jgi:hypothetical protein
LIFKDEPFSFHIRTHLEKPKTLDEQNDLIPLINDINNNQFWRGKTYPKALGWQSMKLEQDTTQVFHFYVTDTTKWKSMKSHKTFEANKRQFETSKTESEPYTTRQPLTLVWLYLLFLLCIGYLWLEPKL